MNATPDAASASTPAADAAGRAAAQAQPPSSAARRELRSDAALSARNQSASDASTAVGGGTTVQPLIDRARANSDASADASALTQAQTQTQTQTPQRVDLQNALQAGSAAGAAQAFAVREAQARLNGGSSEAKVGEGGAASAVGSTPAAGALTWLAPVTTGTAANPTAVSAGHIAASPGSAEFAPQLAAQVSTFVRDGVQNARLELNPAEMGPLTVQIQLEGNAARVHLAAEHAGTRQALEQAMPQLAGSLRDSGLTLSGGGVFEQPRQPQQQAQQQHNPMPNGSADGRPGDQRSGGGTAGSGADPVGNVVNMPARKRSGVVDLVA